MGTQLSLWVPPDEWVGAYDVWATGQMRPSFPDPIWLSRPNLVGCSWGWDVGRRCGVGILLGGWWGRLVFGSIGKDGAESTSCRADMIDSLLSFLLSCFPKVGLLPPFLSGFSLSDRWPCGVVFFLSGWWTHGFVFIPSFYGRFM